jgi:hypothetical protein
LEQSKGGGQLLKDGGSSIVKGAMSLFGMGKNSNSSNANNNDNK